MLAVRNSQRNSQNYTPVNFQTSCTMPENGWSWAHDQLVAELTGTELKLYLRYKKYFNHKKQAAWPRHSVLAQDLGCSVKTIGNAKRKLVQRGLIASKRRRGSCHVKLLTVETAGQTPEKNCRSDRKKIADLEPDLLNQNQALSSAYAPESATKTVAESAPVFDVRASEEISHEETETKNSIPEETAIQDRPRLRGNHQHHHESRQRRRPRYTPAEKAAVQVMAVLGISPALWLTREAIAHAVETWTRQHGKAPEWSVNPLVARWKDYCANRHRLRYTWDPISFFGANHWQNPALWPVDVEAARMAARVSVGMYRPPPQVALAALKAKMEALLGSAEVQP